ncbi:MAG TPA: hypothetical protein VNL17_06640 [Verrucomicrobiae bacterium]|nr:hypothetical protein [Verrucomicrobiae bacterium]
MAIGALVWLSLLSPVFLGCSPPSKPEFIPITNGFGYIHYKGGIDLAPSADLAYKCSDGKVIILCWLRETPFIKGDMAILIGAEKQADRSERSHVGSLIAVKAPGPAVDVTEDVVRMGAKQQNKDADKLLQSYGFPKLVQRGSDADKLIEGYRLPPLPKTGDEFVVVIGVVDPGNRNTIVIPLNWTQIANLINAHLHK